MKLAHAVPCALVLAASGCGAVQHGLTGPAGAAETQASRAAAGGEPASPDTPGEPYAWQPETHSPQPALAHDELGRACSSHDAALDRVATFIAERELRGGAPVDADAATAAMRAEGAPYVWPHLWLLSGQKLGGDAPSRFGEWLASLARVNELRCGSALARGRSREVAAAVAVDVLADMQALPTNVRPSTWLDVRATMLVPTSAAEVLVLGPRGRPHAAPTSFDGRSVRARVNLDDSGRWLVQVLATVEGGPRPVAEAVVFAGDAPTTLVPPRALPGESAVKGLPPVDALVTLVNEARASEGVAPLVHDARLDRVAEGHAEVMRAAHHLAHEGTDGSPADRFARAGITARAVGENVAHAADATSAERALWQSPSHRSNLLETQFNALGVGVARDADGTLWVCEVFAARATE